MKVQMEELFIMMLKWNKMKTCRRRNYIGDDKNSVAVVTVLFDDFQVLVEKAGKFSEPMWMVSTHRMSSCPDSDSLGRTLCYLNLNVL